MVWVSNIYILVVALGFNLFAIELGLCVCFVFSAWVACFVNCILGYCDCFVLLSCVAGCGIELVGFPV